MAMAGRGRGSGICPAGYGLTSSSAGSASASAAVPQSGGNVMGNARLLQLVAQMTIITDKNLRDLMIQQELVAFVEDEDMKIQLTRARELWASRRPPEGAHPDGSLKQVCWLIILDCLFERMMADPTQFREEVKTEVNALVALGQAKLGATIDRLHVAGRRKEAREGRAWVWRVRLCATTLGIRMRSFLVELTPAEWKVIRIVEIRPDRGRQSELATEVLEVVQRRGWLVANPQASGNPQTARNSTLKDSLEGDAGVRAPVVSASGPRSGSENVSAPSKDSSIKEKDMEVDSDYVCSPTEVFPKKKKKNRGKESPAVSRSRSGRPPSPKKRGR